MLVIDNEENCLLMDFTNCKGMFVGISRVLARPGSSPGRPALQLQASETGGQCLYRLSEISFDNVFLFYVCTCRYEVRDRCEFDRNENWFSI